VVFKPSINLVTPLGSCGLQYRADIDGLRAVAILPVVFYHAGVAPFGGGFVGVDVFFVISGFLITSLIVFEMKAGNFYVSNFYQRRMRRILPALFVVLAFSAVVGWFILAPHDYKLLGQSIFATTYFSSNILFWRHSGYFDAPAAERPLLHTWSLAVEEQFYVIFPLYLILIFRFLPRLCIPVTVTLCALSFCVAAVSVKSHPNAAFFLAPQRVWELLLGGLLALKVLPTTKKSSVANALSIVGLLLIVIPVFNYSKATVFPGASALLPTLGAFAIIWAGVAEQPILNRFLSLSWPVFLGKISYSLYLWHFPLLAFAAYLSIDIGEGKRILIVAVSAMFAVASWLYIEQPVRQGRGLFASRKVVFSAAAASLVVFGAVGLATYFSGGFPGRVSPDGLQILAAADDFDPDRDACSTSAAWEVVEEPFCTLGIAEGVPRFILWGDSHAETLRPGLDQIARSLGQAGIFAGRGGCAPVLEVERLDEPECLPINQAIVKRILASPTISTVILAARWGLWANGTRYKREARNPIAIARAEEVGRSNAHDSSALAAGLDRTIAVLQAAEKHIWLVGPIPEVGYAVPRALYIKSVNWFDDVDIRPTTEEFMARQRLVLALFENLTQKYAVGIIWPHALLCDAKLCYVEMNGKPLYSDDNHLTRSAAKYISPIFAPIFR
jgi:peptidoglycan/LPS O-acetylase OafA/YrhL